MISECLDRKKSFGVVRAKEEGVAEIGCTAEIITVAKKYPDGRMDIVTEGRERFEVMQVSQERSFLQAEVLYLRDEPGQATAEEIAQALKLQGEILRLAGSEPPAPAQPDASQLSFRLVGPLPLDLDFKQTLLGMKSEAERMRRSHFLFRSNSAKFAADGAGAPKGRRKRPRPLSNAPDNRIKTTANRRRCSVRQPSGPNWDAVDSLRRFSTAYNPTQKLFSFGGFHHESAAHARRIAP